jgi:hypothetical protein
MTSKERQNLTGVETVDGKLSETISVYNTCEFDHRIGTNGAVYENLKMKLKMSFTVPVDERARQSSVTATRTVTETVSDSRGTRDVSDEWTREQGLAEVGN